MAIYKLQKPALESEATSVLLDQGGGNFLSIPITDPNTTKTDYIEYKAWCDAGNTPDPVS